MKTQPKFSDKCKQDLFGGKAVYIRPAPTKRRRWWERRIKEKERGDGILSFNGIRIDRESLNILVNNEVIVTFAMPDYIDFDRGDTATFEFANGTMTIKIE